MKKLERLEYENKVLKEKIEMLELEVEKSKDEKDLQKFYSDLCLKLQGKLRAVAQGILDPDIFEFVLSPRDIAPVKKE